ncbi:MAG: hypothetical protein Q9162_003041 [Coniocarpon cinnabarinum]
MCIPHNLRGQGTSQHRPAGTSLFNLPGDQIRADPVQRSSGRVTPWAPTDQTHTDTDVRSSIESLTIQEPSERRTESQREEPSNEYDIVPVLNGPHGQRDQQQSEHNSGSQSHQEQPIEQPPEQQHGHQQAAQQPEPNMRRSRRILRRGSPPGQRYRRLYPSTLPLRIEDTNSNIEWFSRERWHRLEQNEPLWLHLCAQFSDHFTDEVLVPRVEDYLSPAVQRKRNESVNFFYLRRVEVWYVESMTCVLDRFMCREYC